MRSWTALVVTLFCVSSFAQDVTSKKPENFAELVKKISSEEKKIADAAVKSILEDWNKWTDNELKTMKEGKDKQKEDVVKRIDKVLNEISARKEDMKWAVIFCKFENELLKKDEEDGLIEVVRIRSDVEKYFGSKKRFCLVGGGKMEGGIQKGYTLHVIGIDGKRQEVKKISELSDVIEDADVKLESSDDAKKFITFISKLVVGTEEFSQVYRNYYGYNSPASVNINSVTLTGDEEEWKANVLIMNYIYVSWKIETDEDCIVSKVKGEMKQQKMGFHRKGG